jgi:hypothetical protein
MSLSRINSTTTVGDQETKSLTNAIAGVHVNILCIQEDLEPAMAHDKSYVDSLTERIDNYTGYYPQVDQTPI